MALLIAVLLTTTVVGIPLVLAVDPRARGGVLAGLSFLYGAGLVWALMLLLSLVHIRWSGAIVTAGILLCSSAVWMLRTKGGAAGHVVGDAEEDASLRWHGIAPVVDLLTAYTTLCAAMYATLARVWEWDFWAIWGLKGRVFIEARGIDWGFLRSPFNDYAHPDYPLLVPLNYAYAALISGGWDDRWLALVALAFGVAVLLIVRSLAAREAGAFVASILTLTATVFVFSQYVGLAESPLIAYAAAGILFIRRSLLFDDSAAMRHGAILLGLAASTKNEGLALIGCAAVALFFCRGVSKRAFSEVLRLWPAVAIAAPWLVIRSAVHLTTDIVRGSFTSRFLERLPEAAFIGRLLIAWLPDAAMWLLMLTGILLMQSDRRRRERFVLLVVLLQVAAYVAAYFGTPRDVQWHIVTSWPRLARHMATPLLYVVMIALAQSFSRVETLAHAEARPQLS